MSEYNWCHNPKCHTYHTTDRIRGVKGKKVLRTRKINISSSYIQETIWSYFCNNSCLFSFLNQFRQQVANLNPTTEPSETPIDVVKEKVETYRYNWNSGSPQQEPHTYYQQKIKPIENNQ